MLAPAGVDVALVDKAVAVGVAASLVVGTVFSSVSVSVGIVWLVGDVNALLVSALLFETHVKTANARYSSSFNLPGF